MSTVKEICFIYCGSMELTLELIGKSTIEDLLNQVISEMNLPDSLPPKSYLIHNELGIKVPLDATCDDFKECHNRIFINHDSDYRYIKYIEQKHSHGCAIACLAMVTGKAYDYVRDYFSGFDFNEKGITWYEDNDFLLDHGYAINWKYACTQGKGVNQEREKWPPELWAAIHIIIVATSQGSHAVVMKKDGTIFDPLCPTRETLDGFLGVTQVIGVYKV